MCTTLHLHIFWIHGCVSGSVLWIPVCHARLCLHMAIMSLSDLIDKEHIADRPYGHCQQHHLFIVRTFVHDRLIHVQSNFYRTRGNRSANHQKEPERLSPKPRNMDRPA
jgi:hypothetical protein